MADHFQASHPIFRIKSSANLSLLQALGVPNIRFNNVHLGSFIVVFSA